MTSSVEAVKQALKNDVGQDHTRAPTPVQVPTGNTTRSLICGPETIASPYPVYMQGEVCRGFGRGSKELGCPTANLPDEAIAPHKDTLETGVHFGFAQVAYNKPSQQMPGEHDRVWPMVMSIGWNPYYKNEKRTAEVHVLHDFPGDFYGQHLKVVILGFIRPEYNYPSLDALIEDINLDKVAAVKSVERSAYQSYQQDPFFSSR